MFLTVNRYPDGCVEDLAELADQVPKFCFPYPEKASVALKRQEFTFVFTDAEGLYVFGYCLQKVGLRLRPANA